VHRHVAGRLPRFCDGSPYGAAMGIIGWILIGLIMGALAKAALNRRGGSWVGSLLIGVVGALVGGFLGSIAFNRGIGSFWSPWTWLLAFVGSVIVLAVWSAISGRSPKR
jgi:uncharacterized membrane protein YeaQ/YmgE (transglycosylase-associated protein family)